MKILIYFFIFIIVSCAGKSTISDHNNTIKYDKPNVSVIKTGWKDNDTYTVKVVANSNNEAIEKAKHIILQDIVKVRMMNESRYTDIKKISGEFEPILKNGKIINEKKLESKIEYLYRITDKNLKDKFKKK